MKSLTQERDDLHKVEPVFQLFEWLCMDWCFVHIHIDTVTTWLPVLEKLTIAIAKITYSHKMYLLVLRNNDGIFLQKNFHIFVLSIKKMTRLCLNVTVWISLWSGPCGGQWEAEVSVERAEGSPQSKKTGHAGIFRAQWKTHRPQVKPLPFIIFSKLRHLHFVVSPQSQLPIENFNAILILTTESHTHTHKFVFKSQIL